MKEILRELFTSPNSTLADSTTFGLPITIKPPSDTLHPFINILHRSLEVKTVLSSALNQLNASFEITTIEFSTSGHAITWTVGQETDHHDKVTNHFTIETENECLGYLALSMHRALSPQDHHHLCDCLTCLIYPLKNALQYQSMLQQTLTDPLTGCGNRLAMDSFLADQWHSFERYHHRFSLLMIDIDHFKAINDNFGHYVGDQVLQKTADTLKDNVRNSDRIFRYGGEEFLVVLTHTDKAGCQVIAERIRLSVADMNFKSVDKTLSVTTSIGVATSLEKNSTYQALLQQADKALYSAKRRGRNRIESMTLEHMPS